MITLLALGNPDRAEALAGAHPSFEILKAKDCEQALEKLARNRRIDAILIDRDLASEAIALLRAEDPSGPPLFIRGAGPEIQGAIALPDDADLLDNLARLLMAG